MRIQSVVLEYHCDIAVFRLHIVHELAVDDQLAAGNFLQSGDHTQGCGFTASGGSYKDDELLVLDIQVEILYCLKSVGINFCNVFQ